MDRFQIHVNFTRKKPVVYEFGLDGLAEPDNFTVLRNVFHDPDMLCPETRREKITKKAADRFGELADGMRVRNIPPMRASHFLMKLIFCMFGEHIGLLPGQVFSRTIEAKKANPPSLSLPLKSLFGAMSKGGSFGPDTIPHFNGGLFDDADVITLTPGEANTLAEICKYDWSSIEPTIFGTLFERILDPDKRSQIGAHYTSVQDIETLLKPVLLDPLLREWEEVQKKCDGGLFAGVIEKKRRSIKSMKPEGLSKSSRERKKFERTILDFAHRLSLVTVLDPACGSGNFLYVALHMLLDLEKEVLAYASTRGLSFILTVNPTQLHGLEINPYAQQLAQVAIWIGYLQWMHHNGFKIPDDPILAPIESIECRDAILDLSDPRNPREPEWPAADFIVGNPPFLGGKLLRTNLGDEYVDTMFRVWDGRVPREADLCTYWFEKARRQIESKKCGRAGLLATQGIRGGANRKVLQQIQQSGEIFFAESDRDWILEGATVHVSMVGFDAGDETARVLNGAPVAAIHANLRATADTTTAGLIPGNVGVSFMGDTKGGAFDISETDALDMLHAPNPHGQPNSDVVVPWMNGLDVTRRHRRMWIIDFGVDRSIEQAAGYEKPLHHVEERIRPERMKNKRESYREKWWLHVEPRPAMREAFSRVTRFLATARVAKHRLFMWSQPPIMPDCQLIVFARDDDYFFGVLHSRVHEVWALQQGTQVREKESGFRYTPTSCFETFPLHESTARYDDAIGCAARELDDLRTRWLNPPEWTKTETLEFPGSVDGPWARYIQDPDSRGIGTVRWPRLLPKDADCADSLKSRTLTNLYNERPTWLDLAHKKLDAAVFAAYDWKPDISDEEILERLLALNLERSASG